MAFFKTVLIRLLNIRVRLVSKFNEAFLWLSLDKLFPFSGPSNAQDYTNPRNKVSVSRYIAHQRPFSGFRSSHWAYSSSLWLSFVQSSPVSYFRLLHSSLLQASVSFRVYVPFLLFEMRKVRGDAVAFLAALFVVCFIDALITDDEPLFEPVEWSLVQSWVLFIFGLAWVAENLICSRYGSYTGRDKRVWFAWYKTFWLIEGWYVLSFGAASMFVITPFYNEFSYDVVMVVTWWNRYSRVFFFNFLSFYTILLYLAYYLQLSLRHTGWKKSLFYVAVINLGLGYLLYSQFILSFFCYLTDPNWYHKTRLVDYVQLSHEPNKWAWGNAKRDHFSYHRSTTVFWFKTDSPFAAALMLFNIFFFFCLFWTYVYWVILFRRIYATREVSYTYVTYCTSALRQFMYFFLLFYVLVFFSYVVSYWRLPIETFWMFSMDSFPAVLGDVAFTYPGFLLSLVSWL